MDIYALLEDGTTDVFVLLEYGASDSWKKIHADLQFIQVAAVEIGETYSSLVFFKIGGVYQLLIGPSGRIHISHIPVAGLPDVSFVAGPMVADVPNPLRPKYICKVLHSFFLMIECCMLYYVINCFPGGFGCRF